MAGYVQFGHIPDGYNRFCYGQQGETLKGGLDLSSSTEYNQAYNRKKSIEKLSSVVRANFQSAALITFQFKPGAPVSFSFVRKYLLSWDISARKRLGGKYEFVRIMEYVNERTGEMLFHYITALTPEQCEKVVEGWPMGRVEVRRLLRRDLEKPQSILPLHPGAFHVHDSTKYKRWWSYTRGIKNCA